MISTALMHHIQQRLPAASTHALVSSSLSAGAATGIQQGCQIVMCTFHKLISSSYLDPVISSIR